MMSDGPNDWTNWIVTTLAAVISTVVGTVVFLVKFIESRFTTEIAELKKLVTELNTKLDACKETHHDAEIRLAKLEAIHGLREGNQ